MNNMSRYVYSLCNTLCVMTKHSNNVMYTFSIYYCISIPNAFHKHSPECFFINCSSFSPSPWLLWYGIIWRISVWLYPVGWWIDTTTTKNSHTLLYSSGQRVWFNLKWKMIFCVIPKHPDRDCRSSFSFFHSSIAEDVESNYVLWSTCFDTHKINKLHHFHCSIPIQIVISFLVLSSFFGFLFIRCNLLLLLLLSMFYSNSIVRLVFSSSSSICFMFRRTNCYLRILWIVVHRR